MIIMKRRKFIGASALALISGTAMANEKSAVSEDNNPLKPGIIVHSVYFWLNDNATQEDEKQCLKFFAILAKVPGVHTISYGKPAPTNKRDVVDHSYAFNLIVTFKSMEDINVYEKHPDHLEASKQYKKYWKKVEVRDTLLM